MADSVSLHSLIFALNDHSWCLSQKKRHGKNDCKKNQLYNLT